MKYNRIMLAGPSGYGKTTLAKWISEQYDIPFESGSVSDLLPQTKDISHQNMLSRDADILYKEDFQILNLRNKLFKEKESFVSDRSYLDSAGYFLYKQADKQPSCELEHFIGLCSMLVAQQCDCLILLNFLPELVSDWVTEDNQKRITNNYFQVEISSIMYTALHLMGYHKRYLDHFYTKKPTCIWDYVCAKKIDLQYGLESGNIYTIYGQTKVYVINEPNLGIRKDLINHILS